jgi:hypothetical protein
MHPRCWLPRRRRQLEHNQCHGPFNFVSPPDISDITLRIVIPSEARNPYRTCGDALPPRLRPRVVGRPCLPPFPSICTRCAFTIARINPGKRPSISSHREVFRISTPTRSPRINPASLKALKCCDKVDLGMSFSLTFKKFEQICEQFDPAMSEKIATRTGSASA